MRHLCDSKFLSRLYLWPSHHWPRQRWCSLCCQHVSCSRVIIVYSDVWIVYQANELDKRDCSHYTSVEAAALAGHTRWYRMPGHCFQSTYRWCHSRLFFMASMLLRLYSCGSYCAGAHPFAVSTRSKPTGSRPGIPTKVAISWTPGYASFTSYDGLPCAVPIMGWHKLLLEVLSDIDPSGSLRCASSWLRFFAEVERRQGDAPTTAFPL